MWQSLVLAAGTLASAATGSPGPVRYDDKVVVRADPADAAELEIVLDLAIDVWSERIGVGPIDVMLDPDGAAALAATAIPHRVVIPDVQRLADAHRSRVALPARPVDGPGPWFSAYRTLDEVYEYADALQTLRPDLVDTFEVGQSYEGRSIRALRISAVPDTAPAVLFNGCQHAREWIAVMVPMCIADTLVRDYDTDARIRSLLDATEVLIVPIVNPDGYLYTWNEERFWRKSRRPPYGVDLNRNWGVAWGGKGSSSELDSGNYRGTGPFSEPETRGLRDLILSRPDLVSHVDFHAYAQLILYPWGFDHVLAPADETLSVLGDRLHDAMLSVNGMNYDPIQGTDFYPAAGNMPDWTYGDRGLWSFTIELRPAESDGAFEDGFALPPEQIIPTCEEAMAAAISVMEWTATQGGPGPAGDDGDAPYPDPETDTGSDGGDGSTTLDPSGGTTSSGDGGMDDGPADSGSGPTAGGASSSETSEGMSDEDAAGRGCSCAATDASAVWAWLIVPLARRRTR